VLHNFLLLKKALLAFSRDFPFIPLILALVFCPGIIALKTINNFAFHRIKHFFGITTTTTTTNQKLD